MARSYAAIHQRIWADPEWRALDLHAQHLYVLLISQPHLNLAGVLPLQLRKWASCVNGWDIADVAAALERLRGARFVLVDEDTEEVLVRSLIRNDGSYKIPNALKSLLQAAEGTQAPALRAELAVELGRIDPPEGKKAEESLGLIAATRLALGGFGGPSGPGGEPMPQPMPEPMPEGLGNGLLATHAGRVDSNSDRPMPEPIGSGSGSGTSLSLVRNLAGGSTTPAPLDRPENCAKHQDLGDDAPPCRACKRLRENWEAVQTEAAKPKPKPKWCGHCNESSRLMEPDEGPSYRCKSCHPLAKEAS